MKSCQEKLNKLNKNFIIINKIRLIFFMFILILLGTLILEKNSIYWLIYILILSIFFIIIFVFYIPSYYKSFSYLLTEDYIIIFSGVIFYKKILLKISSITKINIYQTWFQKIFKVKSVIFFSPGQTTLISCLDKQSIDKIFLEFDNKFN
ncbi:MAG: PH domain-containing protein [Oscillospiraceae bacterium]|nr:PH domain-containing protein [Oscillospiraceae bacterium]